MIREIVPTIHRGLRQQLKGYPAPLMVPVRPQPNCVPNQCWINVPELIEQQGGSPVSGRIVWTESTGKWLHLEAHCNWRLPDGTLIDPTPKVDGETHIVFVEEPLTFAGYAISSRFLCCSGRPVVKRFVELLQQLSEIRSSIPFGEERETPTEYVPLLLEQCMLLPRVYQHDWPPKRVLGRNRSARRRTRR